MLASDALLLRLADPTARSGLLTADALLEIAVTCYAIDPDSVVGDTTAVYDTVDLAVPANPQVSLSGRWSRASDPEPVNLWAALAGLVPTAPAADAVWSGSVVVRTSGGEGVITAADVVDEGRGADGTDQLGVALTFSAPSPVTTRSTPLALPVIVAFLAFDVATSPHDLLAATAAARRAGERYLAAPTPATAPARTFERCVCWLLPGAAFDDEAWPGASGGTAAQQRDARVAAARAWLHDQAICLVPVG